ncbi:MAG: hypothetical protein OK456_06950 [Thaumarchaeota archaeon]|nr:hypothetical protein [Nitrososphaerota archaeon]
MSQQSTSQVPEFSGERFVQELEAINVPKQELSKMIKTAFTDLFGELSATTALCYVGDASNGDLKSFVVRTDELFGASASLVFKRIASAAANLA